MTSFPPETVAGVSRPIGFLTLREGCEKVGAGFSQ